MIIECPNCESKVDAKVLAEHGSMEDYGPVNIAFLECPVCKESLLAHQDYIQTGPKDWDWSEPVRIWPAPEKFLGGFLPDMIAEEFLAKKCFKAKAYDACAVMCGRVLEAIWTEYKTKNKFLRGGLKELLDKQIIDKRIYEWGEALRKHRNIGAHATGEKISKDDARYLLDFAEAICEYIFVLTKKFEMFIESKKVKERGKREASGSKKL